MNAMNSWQKSLGIGALVSLAVTALPSVAMPATDAPAPQRNSAPAATSLPGEFQVAQASGACRRVDVNGGLNIRERPTTDSRVIGVLVDGARVNIENQGSSGWVPLNEPKNGYVSADYLKYCTASVPAPRDCAQVEASGGLHVRRQPTTNSAIIRTLQNGRYITIEPGGGDEWMPISAPVSGYVASDYLQACS